MLKMKMLAKQVKKLLLQTYTYCLILSFCPPNLGPVGPLLQKKTKKKNKTVLITFAGKIACKQK